MDVFLDKVHGCWYGKCLGGAAGAPLEGVKELVTINDFTEVYNPDLPNDDLDIQLLWIDVLENKGYNINSSDLADAWIEKCWYPFSEYGYFMKNYMRGIKPPYSGIINNSFFKEGMGCPIRSEIWGIICAGKPEIAVQYAYMDACLDHADNSIYAEQFLAAVGSLAFERSDIYKLIIEGLKYIPENSKLHNCIKLVIKCFDNGDDFISARKKMLDKFGHPDFTNSVQNLGIITIALLYGKGDMRDTINIALKCGYDTDCTCASAASVIGIIKGYEALGELTSLINDYFICGVDVKRSSDSIKDLAEECVRLAKNLPDDIKLDLEYQTEEGLKNALSSIEPVPWKIYGPYYEQPNWPMNKDYPSPHEEGCVLPDLVCMVNNEVLLDKEYEKGDVSFVVNAYEDLIELDEYIKMQGQYACVAETTVISDKKQKVWLVIGNNDGFTIHVNGKEVLKKDEIRLWTPYNNFCLIDLEEGENRIELKLLKRTEMFKFSIGFRIYNGTHWHKSKWCTDLKYRLA